MTAKKDISNKGGTLVLRNAADCAEVGYTRPLPAGQMSVAVFLGEQPDSSRQVKIRDIRDDGQSIIVDYFVIKGGVGVSMVTYPYDERLIPLSDKPVVFNDITPPAFKKTLGPAFK